MTGTDRILPPCPNVSGTVMAQSSILRPSRPRPCRGLRTSLAALAVTLFAVGCEPATPLAPVPRPPDLAEADPWVAEVIEETADRVAAAPGDAEAWATLGEVYYAHDYFGLAIDAFAASLELEPDRPVVRYLLAVARRANGDTAAALADLDLALQLDDATPHLRWRAAEWLIDTGDLDRAASMAEAAVRLDPDDRTAIRMLARVRLEQGRPEETIELVTPLLTTTPDDPEVRSLRGRALRAAGRMDEAARDMLIAGTVQPTWFDDWINRVLIRRTDLAWWIRRIQRTANGGRTEPAREMLAELRRRHPDAREVDFTEGVILVNERRLDDAVTLFGQLVEADPDWPAARIRAAATLLARADASADAIAAIDDRIAAEAMLVAALANEPDNADGLALLVAAREAMGRPADTVEPLRTLVERVPGERRHRYRLARALVAAGEPVEAVAVLDAAVQALGPEGPPATVLRVEALLAAGRTDEAAAVAAAFRTRTPRHPAVAEMQRLIDSGARP